MGEVPREPVVSVVIVSFNVRDYLLRALSALDADSTVPMEVIVVDNASTDGSADAVEQQLPHVTVVRNDTNEGFGRANNTGFERSSGDLVLLLNPDVIVDRGCLKAMADFLLATPAAGAVGPRLRRPDGGLDLAARRGFPTPSAAFYRVVGLSRLFRKSPRFNRYNMGAFDDAAVHEIDAGTAACLMVRRAAVDKVGLFDPDFFMYGEDLDLCFRLKQGGWKIFYLPEAGALHVKGASSRQATGPMLYEFHRAMWRFHRKHYAASLPAPVNGLVWSAIWARWAVLRARLRLSSDPKVSP
jgi:GT2 family glycosyltransferase